jgi:large subunit ribosomal protein L3
LDDSSEFELGQAVSANLFTNGQIVDVSGTSIGRGFAGYQKRHNFKRGPMAHGSKNHRQPGSTGAGTTPGRTFPGKRMAGRLGGDRVTIRKLEVVRVDADRNLLLIKGAVPGKPGALLSITPAKQVGR